MTETSDNSARTVEQSDEDKVKLLKGELAENLY